MSIQEKSTPRSLYAATLAAIGASLCCVAPLALLAMGIGGAWIGTLTALEPYRPVFIAITALFLWLAFRKLYLTSRSCTAGASCAVQTTLRNQRVIFWVVAVMLAALLSFPYYAGLLLA